MSTVKGEVIRSHQSSPAQVQRAWIFDWNCCRRRVYGDVLKNHDVGLSENMVPLNALVNPYSPYYIFYGWYYIFRHTHVCNAIIILVLPPQLVILTSAHVEAFQTLGFFRSSVLRPWNLVVPIYIWHHLWKWVEPCHNSTVFNGFEVSRVTHNWRLFPQNKW